MTYVLALTFFLISVGVGLALAKWPAPETSRWAKGLIAVGAAFVSASGLGIGYVAIAAIDVSLEEIWSLAMVSGLVGAALFFGTPLMIGIAVIRAGITRLKRIPSVNPNVFT